MMRLLLVLAVLLAGCQMKPTKTGGTQQREFDVVVNKSTKPLVLSEGMVVLDARSAFDYGLNRVVGSHHFPWENLAESTETGELLRDRRKLAQRLALMGVTPDTPIVVVGNGQTGNGEEGRLAWTLLYLGFKDVQTASIEMFRKNLTQMVTPPPKNAQPVEIDPQIEMVAAKDDFKRLADNPKDRRENHIWIVDVRSEKEYFNKVPGQPAQPDIGALNIEWKQFYTQMGRPDPSIRKKLKDLGVGENDRIILICRSGARSSAASYALISLGFRRVENFLPGLRSL